MEMGGALPRRVARRGVGLALTLCAHTRIRRCSRLAVKRRRHRCADTASASDADNGGRRAGPSTAGLHANTPSSSVMPAAAGKARTAHVLVAYQTMGGAAHTGRVGAARKESTLGNRGR